VDGDDDVDVDDDNNTRYECECPNIGCDVLFFQKGSKCMHVDCLKYVFKPVPLLSQGRGLTAS
jgi:hypothetical protein